MVCSRSANCLFQPALPTALRMLTKVMMRVSSRRKWVCMSMMNWSLSALARSWAIAGVAASALLTAQVISHGQQARFDLTLPLVLRIRIKFVTGDDLCRDRRVVLHQFGRHQCRKFFLCELTAHRRFSSLGCPR